MPFVKTSDTGLIFEVGEARAFLIFFVVPLLCYAFPALLRDIYGMEARNALFAREMLEQGVTFVPSLMGKPYSDYPPLYFLLEYLFSLPAGRVSTFTAVLPSALSAAALVWLVWYHVRSFSSHLAVTSAVVLATSPGFFLKATHATVDMLLAFNTFLAFLLTVQALSFSRQEGRGKLLLLSACIVVALSLSLLTKGPAGIAIPLGASAFYLVAERKWRKLGRLILLGSGVSIFLVTSYAALVYVQGGWGLLCHVWQDQVAGRVGAEPNRPFYYYTFYTVVSFLPWFAAPALLSILLEKRGGRVVGAERKGISRKKLMSSKDCSNLLGQCAAALFFIFSLFSMASSRHGRYLLPAFPFVAILLAASINAVTCRVWGKACARTPCGDIGASPGSITSFYDLTGRFTIALAITTSLLLAFNACLIEPVHASRESGRAFMNEIEANVPADTPFYVYGIDPDGDGLKLSFYSANPMRLSFLYHNREEKLNSVNFPALLILYEKRVDEIKQRFRMHRVATGLVHGKGVVAAWVQPL